MDINVLTNDVIVGPKEALNVDEIYLKDMNWIDNCFPTSKNILVKLRNTGNLIEADLKNSDGKIILYPKEPAEGISPGQAAVIYDKDDKNHVLGGGWIVSTTSNFLKKYSLSTSAA